MAPEESRLSPTARRSHHEQPHRSAAEIRRAVPARRDAVIGCYGVTYKPDVNDERESPAWEIVHALQADGYNVRVYDPVVNVGDYVDLDAFAADVDLLAVLVEHSQFAEASNSLDRAGKQMLRF
jgi:UDP-N-acetyl-D-mannosaminuronic acid dehydrogenase